MPRWTIPSRSRGLRPAAHGRPAPRGPRPTTHRASFRASWAARSHPSRTGVNTPCYTGSTDAGSTWRWKAAHDDVVAGDLGSARDPGAVGRLHAGDRPAELGWTRQRVH